MALNIRFLEEIRKDPNSYFGARSLTALFHFLEGHGHAIWQQKSSSQRDHYIPYDFLEWVTYRLRYRYSSSGWLRMILEAGRNEEAAFSLFFELLDEYYDRRKSVFASFSDLDKRYSSDPSRTGGDSLTIVLVAYTHDPGFFVESDIAAGRFFSGLDDFEKHYNIWRWQLDVLNDTIFSCVAAETEVDGYFRVPSESELIDQARIIALVDVEKIQPVESGDFWKDIGKFRQLGSAKTSRLIRGSLPETFELENEEYSRLSTGAHLVFLTPVNSSPYVLSSPLSLRKISNGRILWTDGIWWEVEDLVSRILARNISAIDEAGDSSLFQKEASSDDNSSRKNTDWQTGFQALIDQSMKLTSPSLAEFNRLSLLEKIRWKPGMYMGTKSIIALYFFLLGYHFAVDQFQFQDNSTMLLPVEFPAWVANRLGIGPSHLDWMNMILQTVSDEEMAFDRFFELLDEFSVAHPHA